MHVAERTAWCLRTRPGSIVPRSITVPTATANPFPCSPSCPQECGGLLPWMGWKQFFFSTATPGNGGPLLQPRGQTSVFYRVPPPPPQGQQQRAGKQQPAAEEQQEQRGQQAVGPAATSERRRDGTEQ